jgi:L-lactate dehydrogenase complex protein LldG
VTHNDAARGDILRAVRENLAQGSSPPDPLSVPKSSPPVRIIEGTGGQGVRTFTERLATVGAQCSVVRGEPEAAGALASILSGAGARRVVGSDAPLVQRLLRPLCDRFEIVALERLSRDDLFACDVGVTTAQWGIAETGTLVLESARERSRLLSLVPPIHVAVLSTRCICESLGDALARVSQAASHAITFITGPSRTSDIELTLVVGVHGPQTVHVLLLEDA